MVNCNESFLSPIRTVKQELSVSQSQTPANGDNFSLPSFCGVVEKLGSTIAKTRSKTNALFINLKFCRKTKVASNSFCYFVQAVHPTCVKFMLGIIVFDLFAVMMMPVL